MSAQLLFFLIGSLIAISIYVPVFIYALYKDENANSTKYLLRGFGSLYFYAFVIGFLFHLLAYLIPNS